LEEARKKVQIECERRGLCAEHVLGFVNRDLKGVTVRDVLADPWMYHNETLADPIEGVEYGRTTAKLYVRKDDTPWIKSFAHGLDLRYELVEAVSEDLEP